MIGMNNPRTEGRNVQRGKGRVLAKSIRGEEGRMDFGAWLKYLMPPRFHGISRRTEWGREMMHEYKSALRGWVDSDIA